MVTARHAASWPNSWSMKKSSLMSSVDVAVRMFRGDGVCPYCLILWADAPFT